MKRMVDNKKLSEIEASGGTQWYHHEIKLNQGFILKMMTLFNESLKDFKNIGAHAMIYLDSAGPNLPNQKTTFPTLRYNGNGKIDIYYLDTSTGQLVTYILETSNINTDVVTKI